VALTSRLEDLPGIGPKTAGLLWDRFGSVQSMREAGIEDFLGLPGVGRARAEKIRAALAGLEEIHDR
jgi:excinuclease ABC subunit C